MVDHVVEPEAVTRLLRSCAPFGASAESTHGPGYCDVEEATKVNLEGDRVVAVTRELDDHDAVDAGLAVCDPQWPPARSARCSRARRPWNAVKRRWLAREARSRPSTWKRNLPWTPRRPPADVRRAERLVVAGAAPAKATDGPVARLLDRRLSWRLSLLLLRDACSDPMPPPCSPSSSRSSPRALAAGHERWWAALVAGGILTQMASIVDGVDRDRPGPAAAPRRRRIPRLRPRPIPDAALLAGLALAAGLDTATWAALTAALFGSLLVPYVRAPSRPPSAVRSRRPSPELGAGRDVRLLVVALAALALQPLWGLVAVAVLANLEAAHRLVRARRLRT